MADEYILSLGIAFLIYNSYRVLHSSIWGQLVYRCLLGLSLALYKRLFMRLR